MQKKNLILVFVLVLVGGLFVYPRIFAGSELVTVSDVSQNPNQFMEKKLSVSGSVAGVYADEGYFVIVDEGGCCVVPVVVPTTESQQQYLTSEIGVTVKKLYSGSMPTANQNVVVSGTMKMNGNYPLILVDKVEQGGRVILQ